MYKRQVLHTLSRAFDTIYSLISSRKKRNATHEVKDYRMENMSEVKKKFKWALKLRLKDISCSLLIAGFLPKILDPVEAENFNLSDVTRGAKVVLTESILLANNQGKKFTIVDASIYRVVDGMNRESAPEDVVRFTDLVPVSYTHLDVYKRQSLNSVMNNKKNSSQASEKSRKTSATGIEEADEEEVHIKLNQSLYS